MIQLKVVTGTLNSQKYQDQILISCVKPPLDSLDGQNMVLWDDIERPHFTPIIKEYKNQQNMASLPWQSFLSDLNPIKHVWDTLGWRVWNREPAVSKPLWILLDSTAGGGQDFMSWTHVHLPSKFNDKNVPSFIRQCEGYTQHKPEVVDNYEPVRDFLHQSLKVYAPKRKLWRNYNYHGLIVKVLLTWPPCCFHWIL